MSLDAQKLADLLTAMGSFNSALRNRLDGKLDANDTAANSAMLGGKTLAEVQALIGDAAAADLAALNAEFDAFIARTDNPHAVTKAQVGLGNVDNFGTATNPEAVAGVLTNKFLTPANLAAFWADKVGAAPETLDTIQELAAALQNNPDALSALQQIAGDNQAAIAQLNTDLAAALVTAANDATTKANAAQAAAIAAAATDATTKADAAEADAKAYTDTREVAIRADVVSGLASKLGTLDTAVNSAKLEGSTKAELIAEAQAGVDLSQVVLKTDNFATYQVNGATFADIIAGIKGGSTESLATLEAMLDAFIANKATGVEAIAGTDDSKYITALALKAKVDDAINALVNGAPAALDTLQELATALQDQDSEVAAIVTVLDTKLNQAQVQAEIATALVPVDSRIDALEAAIGEGSNFLEAGTSDLGLNPVVLSGDEVIYSAAQVNPGTATYAVVRNAGVLTITVDPELDGTFVEPGEAVAGEIQTGLGNALDVAAAVDGVLHYVTVSLDSSTLKAHIERLDSSDADTSVRIDNEVATLDARITAEKGTLQAGIQAVQDGVTANTAAIGATNTAVGALDTRVDTLEADIQTKLEAGDAIGTNTVTFPDSGTQLPTQQALNAVLEQLRVAVEAAESGAATDLAALQTAFNNFVAAKATGAEVIAGTDDVKYTTSLAVKAAIQDAIDALVGAAPAALDTINELAAALQGDPNIINNLTSQIGLKLDATAQAADSAKLEGKTIADLTASNADVVAGTATDKFVTPASLSIKQNAQDLAIASNTTAISDLMTQLAAAFDTAADDLDPA